MTPQEAERLNHVRTRLMDVLKDTIDGEVTELELTMLLAFMTGAAMAGLDPQQIHPRTAMNMVFENVSAGKRAGEELTRKLN